MDVQGKKPVPLTPRQVEELRKEPGSISSTETFGTVDGPGIRYVFFMQGCPLRCLYCHNPESIPATGGTKLTAGEAVDDVLRYRKFIQNGGVTFSGGEPLLQLDFVTAAIQLLAAKGIHTAIDTSGIMPLEAVKPVVNAADLLLLDIKAMDEEVCIALTGQSNKNAFKLLEYCEEIHKPVWVRYVLLRGYTLQESQLNALAEYLRRFRCVQKVELLPFHKLGEHKYEQLGRVYQLSDVEATTPEETAWAANILKQHGIMVE